MKWIKGAVFSFLFGTFFVTPLVCNLYSQQALKKLHANEQKLNAILPKFIEDLKVLEAQPPFPEWTRERNAEPLLSRWVQFDAEGYEKLDTPNHKILAKLFDKYPLPWKDEKQFKAFAADPLLAQIDTGWVNELKDYDHWRTTAHPKIQEKLADMKEKNSIARIGIYASIVIPDFKQYRQWVFTAFVQAHNKGKTLEGLALHRKAAELSHTTGSLIGNMIAVAMLQAEMNIASYSGGMAWPIVPPNVVQTYKKVSWGWAGMLTAMRREEFPKELTAYLKPQLGLCGGAAEGLSGVAPISDFMEPQFPFEPDFSEVLERERKLAKQTKEICGQQDLTGYLERIPASANPLIYSDASKVYALVSGKSGPDLLPNPARIPFVRRAVGLTLLTIAIPNYMRLYEQDAH